MSMHYQQPSRIERSANTLMRWLAELGIGIAGTRALRVRGRKTGTPRGVVVNLLTVDGTDYVISPRGDTQWARNVRAAGVVELGSRWHRESRAISEVADDVKPAILRRYLARWYWQVKAYVGGLTPESDDADYRAAAPRIPVFALAK
ncbi:MULTISPECIES: nitroreductase/quinone reductase family protein [Mycobacterium]|nr:MULTISPECIES: nitroreductase/quinone reductase family protein [Mycobacterium]